MEEHDENCPVMTEIKLRLYMLVVDFTHTCLIADGCLKQSEFFFLMCRTQNFQDHLEQESVTVILE